MVLTNMYANIFVRMETNVGKHLSIYFAKNKNIIIVYMRRIPTRTGLSRNDLLNPNPKKGVLDPALGFFGALASDSSSSENSLSSKNSFSSETREEEEAAERARERAEERARAAVEELYHEERARAENPTAEELYDAEIEHQNTLRNNYDRFKSLAHVKGKKVDGTIESALQDDEIFRRFRQYKDQDKPVPVIPDYIFPKGLVVRQDPETGKTHIVQQENGISTNVPSRSTNDDNWGIHDDRFFGGKTKRKRKTIKRKTVKKRKTTKRRKSRRRV